MAVEKRCSRVTAHKPHLWSRTTRRTVTEETAGDTLQCPGVAQLGLRTEVDTRGAEIAADARSGTNWAERVGYGPACACGAFQDGGTVTSWGRTVPKTLCYRHRTVRGSRIPKEEKR